MAERRLRQKRPRSHGYYGSLPGVHGNPPEKRPQISGGNSGSRGKGVHAQGCNVTQRIKFPAPYFGGKSKVAALVWQRLGDCDNFIEGFVGSGAVLLARPHPPRIETINDLDCYISCVWRALKHDPEGVAEFADDVVSEADLHSRHRFLVGVERPEPVVPGRFGANPLAREAYLAGYLGEHRTYAAAFRQRMRQDPDYYDVRIAGWYLWGLSCWIGGGFCSVQNADSDQRPTLHGGRTGDKMYGGYGVHMDQGKGNGPPLPRDQGGSGQGDAGADSNAGASSGDAGGPSEPHLRQKKPHQAQQGGGKGVHANPPDGGRPQLADAYSRGRGVHNDNHLSDKRPPLSSGHGTGLGDGVHGVGPGYVGTCAQRRAWLVEWFSRLRDRLRTVRVCCGDFMRVIDSESVTTRLGMTGIFFDAPYRVKLKDGTNNRSEGLYATEGDEGVVDRVIAYCLERGGNPKMRLVAACYGGEGYEVLLKHGWTVESWKSSGGYGNRTKKGKANARRERLFFSPHCLKTAEPGLFDQLEDA